jgi:hypothetical protein
VLLGDYSDTSASSPPWVALRRAVLLYWGAGQWSLTRDRSDRLIARAGSRYSATACAYVYGSFTWELRVSLFLLRRTWEEGELGKGKGRPSRQAPTVVALANQSIHPGSFLLNPPEIQTEIGFRCALRPRPRGSPAPHTLQKIYRRAL